MRMWRPRPHSLTILLVWTCAVASQGPDTYCLQGIVTAVQEFTFAGQNPEDYYGKLCNSSISVISFWANAKVYCTNEEIIAGGEYFQSQCVEGGTEAIPYNNVAPMLTDDFISSLPTVSYADIDPTKVWNTSIMLAPTLERSGVRTISVFERSYSRDTRYGWSVYGFWGIILLIGFLDNAFAILMHNREQRVDGTTEQNLNMVRTQSGPGRAVYEWIYKNLTLPATYGTYHQQLLLWCKVPTRLTTIVIACYWIINLILCCVSYEIFSPNLYYTTSLQKWRYIADRTGTIAYANIPVLWAFSGRNNIFIWLTGWNYATFNLFHRHIARIATIQAIVHSAAYTALEIGEGTTSFATESKKRYWILGIVATISMSLLLGFSSTFLRHHAYEVFLIIHIVLGLATLIGLFYHTDIFNGEYNPYLWPPVAIWVFDRVVRLLRQACCNFGYNSASGFSTTTGKATYDASTNIIRLQVFPGSRRLEPGPGQHHFVYAPFRWRGWENHPFTLAAWNTTERPESEIRTLVSSGNEPKNPSAAVSGITHDNITSIADARTGSQRCFTFLIRPSRGWTKYLREQCEAAQDSTVTLNLLIEGPYGEKYPLDAYSRLVFIVGGSGITAALAYLQGHFESKSTRTNKITFIWTTKQAAMIHDVASKELLPYLNREDIELSFHATLSTTDVDREIKSEVDADKFVGSRPRIIFGRPDIKTSVMGAVGETKSELSKPTSQSVAVIACGPAEMLDEARDAVHHALIGGATGVKYFEESFGW